ncbi:lipase, partial [Rhizoctonia solani AG-3 Rhs1AP]
MVSGTRFFTILLVGATTIVASPTLVPQARVTQLTAEKIEALKPYALLARAAFCSPAKLITWSCGTACIALPGMDVEATSEEDGLDACFRPPSSYPDFQQVPLDLNLFPGVPSSIMVHSGFRMAQATSAFKKLEAVKALMAKYGSPSITFTGLGRGGAISFLDALCISQNIPKAKIKVVTHGMPRVGNRAFANYIDKRLHDVSRITKEKDPLPIIPAKYLDYQHSSGEKHLLSEDSWVACVGQDNTDAQCSTGAVPNMFQADPENNKGPYNDIIIDKAACDA